GFMMGIQVPSPEERVDPRTVSDSLPWSEPGLRELSDGKYEAYIMSQTWQFVPREIFVPADSEVTFHVTSKDVQHGFKLQDTNINMQILPGHVSTLKAVFDEPGEHDFICTEFCGNGHGAMYGTLIVAEMVNIPGTQQTGIGCSDDWKPDCSESALTLGDNGLWSGTFNIPAGDYEVKVAVNGNMDINFGMKGIRDGDNIAFSVPVDTDVTFTFDSKTSLLNIIGDGVEVAEETTE
ncbi:MAG: hypothetical protein GY803_17610, partial [Chloroflexi bacterium]|nr:hypothetical protein [Chloroflexota bacterium]